MNGKDTSCEKNELKVVVKVMGQIRFETRNGKESFSRPEKKIEVWIEKRVLVAMGVVWVPFLHSSRNVSALRAASTD